MYFLVLPSLLASFYTCLCYFFRAELQQEYQAAAEGHGLKLAGHKTLAAFAGSHTYKLVMQLSVHVSKKQSVHTPQSTSLVQKHGELCSAGFLY